VRTILIILLLITLAVSAQAVTYQPTWESLDARPTPQWYDDAKFGIFIHWGVYSVPAWGPKGSYAEWYWHNMNDPNNPTAGYHKQTYGEKFAYQDFAPQFKAEHFDPDQWADVLAKSGAKYVVLTSKHHEGFALWPSAQSWNWNSMDIGPHRDLCGDLTKSVKAKGLRMGFYYSLYEWYNPTYRSDFKGYVDNHMIPQLKDLVTRYQPSLIWPDGEWEYPSSDWKSTEFLAWLFNESPVKDEVAVDDRWGKDTRGKHGGFYTTEYGNGGENQELLKQHKWEECRGIGASFGYNRNEDIQDYKSATDLVHLLVDTVSRGGNLLLDIGPTADGRIPVIMQERLLEIGDWLRVNGEAIYGTHPWRVASEGDVRYTCTAGVSPALYAIALKWPDKELVLTTPKPTQVTMPNVPTPLKWRYKDGKLRITIPPLSVDEAPCRHAYVFKLAGVQ
jgi:alpha-L-fucosidase